MSLDLFDLTGKVAIITGASREGVKQMTMSLTDDEGRYGITVNRLAQGWFKTAQTKVFYDNQEGRDYLIDGGISTGSTKTTV